MGATVVQPLLHERKIDRRQETERDEQCVVQQNGDNRASDEGQPGYSWKTHAGG